MKPLLCIYHGNCADGFGSAWVVWRYYRAFGLEVEFHAGVHQNEPPDTTGRHVLLVDFSYKRPVMIEMGKKALSVLILDHHKSAVEDLKENPDERIYHANMKADPPLCWAMYSDIVMADAEIHGEPAGVHCVFDMNRSGAGLTWDFFNPTLKRPTLIDHIEDRDLWRFALPKTQEIQAALFSYPYDFNVWDKLIEVTGSEPMFLAREGEAIERKHFKDIHELIEVVTIPIRFTTKLNSSGDPFDTIVVPAANLPYTMTSDAGHALCESTGFNGRKSNEAPGHSFAACYWITPEGVVFSLRSQDDGADVSEIAKCYGGGGHKHAAGFRVPFETFVKMRT